MRTAILLFVVTALWAPVTAQRILTIDGKRADRCHQPALVGLRTIQAPNAFDSSNLQANVFAAECVDPDTAPVASGTIYLTRDPAGTAGFPTPAATQTLSVATDSAAAIPFSQAAPPTRGFVCLARLNQLCRDGCDLTLDQYPVTQTGTTDNFQFTIRQSTAAALPAGATAGTGASPIWNSVALETENAPRRLCWVFENTPADRAVANTALWTGTYVASVLDCNQPLGCALYGTMTAQRRSICCTSTVQAAKVGICINPDTHTCCGGAFVSRALDKCCNQVREIVSRRGAACPCSRTLPCLDEAGTQEREVTCCLPSKFPFLRVVSPAGVELPQSVADEGDCYDPTRHLCCNTGSRYDPGTNQCCVINGIQSRDLPCPCGVDADCRGGNNGTNDEFGNFTCCRQTTPNPRETDRCSIFTNYPTGTGDFRVQTCTGTCLDPRFQICCNGRVCQSEFEKCCNSTCCNRYIGSCNFGRRSGAPRNKFNWLFRNINDKRYEEGPFETCTIVEQMSAIKAFWIFVLPTFLLFGMLLFLALAIIFANQSSSRRFTTEERALIALAILAILFAFPLFFSPGWKFGMVVQGACLVAIIAAAALNFPLAAFAAAFCLLATLYIIDPFHGNGYLNTAMWRQDNGDIDPWTSGVLWTVYKIWRNVEPGRVEGEITRDTRWCTRYYDYFAFDYNLQDYERFDNPAVTTFGYCSRGWTFTLLMFTGFMLIFMVLVLALALLVALQRYRKDVYEPIELEVRDAAMVQDPFVQ